MSDDTRILFITLLAGFAVLFVRQIVVDRDLAGGVRAAERHVVSAVGEHKN